MEKSTSSSSTEPRGLLDLVFLVDNTGSMGSYIREVQTNVKFIVNKIVEEANADVKIAVVTYRDHPPQDSSYVVKVHDFSGDLNTIQEYVNQMAANGGGDGPEAVATGMHSVLGLPFRPNSTRVCVFIADAPPHGLEPSGDGFPDGEPNGLDPIEIAHSLATLGVTVYSVGCEPVIGSYVFARDFMKSVASITNGKYLPLRNVKVLAQVIIGGAQEELSMDALMAEVTKEAEAENANWRTDATINEELVTRVASKLQSMGVETPQLQVDDVPEAVTKYAGIISDSPSLKAARKALPADARAPTPSPMPAPTSSSALRSFRMSSRSAMPAEDAAYACSSFGGAEQKAELHKSAISTEQVSRMLSKARKSAY